MAWLHSTPEGQDKTRGETLKGSPMANLPDIDDDYLVKLLFEVGPVVNGFPITFQEIESWSHITGTYLSSWEAVTLKALSSSYLVQLNKSRDIKVNAPYYEDSRDVEEMRNDVSAKFKRLAKKKKAKR